MEKILGSWIQDTCDDSPEDWDMKLLQVEEDGCFGSTRNIYTLYQLGYILLKVHQLRLQDSTELYYRRWCRAGWWCPLWGEIDKTTCVYVREISKSFVS